MKLYLSLFLIFLASLSSAQQHPYGNNPLAGKFADGGDAKIYYETYGSGPVLLLLHGGFFGYIDEYGPYIPEWSKRFRVIAVASRGHGKSEIGKRKFTEALFAQDILVVLKKEAVDSATVIGFSAGAHTGLYLAAYYPDQVKKLVVMGSTVNNRFFQPGKIAEMKAWKYKEIKNRDPEFFTGRENLMAEPARVEEWLQNLKQMYLQEIIIPEQKAKAIKCPVLIVGGDRDEYNKPEASLLMYKWIPKSQLAIVPDTNHVALIFNPKIMTQIVNPFLEH